MTALPPVPGRILLLSPADLSAPAGGRAMLSRVNLVLLRELFGDHLIQTCPPHPASRPREAWRGYVDGVDAAFITELLATIDAHGITVMFVDGSNYGAAVAAVKRRAPQVRVVTFFHNVEARFFWGAMRVARSPRSLAVLAANYLAERRAVRRSDVLVTLSERDSMGLARLYGRGADVIAPMVLEDRLPPTPVAGSPPAEPYMLFVGGGFYANIAGIRWFLRSVAPHVAFELKIVGRGMDELAPDVSQVRTATLVGAVNDLAPWYAGAALVIAPIFDGSGMKTKVAEALMHGKHVAGTPEAFSGYANDAVAANRCCADANDFVAAITEARASPPLRYDPAMRALYERDHSPAAARRRLAAILALETIGPPTGISAG